MNKSNQYTDRIIELLRKSKIEESLEVFLELSREIEDRETEKTLLLLNSQLERLRTRSRHYLITYEEYDVHTNRLIENLLDLLDEKYPNKNTTFQEAFEASTKDRTIQLASRSREIFKMYGGQIVRQKAINSSFSIPNREIRDSVWKKWIRDYHEELRAERFWLEKHVKVEYGKLIISPKEETDYKIEAPEYAMLRLMILREFINSNSENLDVVSVPKGMKIMNENLTIIGEMFYAQAISREKDSWENTYFKNRKVKERIEKFDEEFEELLNRKGLNVFSSKENTLREIDEEISNLRKRI